MKNITSLKKRFSALLLDYLIIVVYIIILFTISMFIYFTLLKEIPTYNELEMNGLGLTVIGPVFLYSVLMESGKSHATLGKRKMKIAVSSYDQKAVRLRQIILRNIIKFLPWQFAHMVIFHAVALHWELSPIWKISLMVISFMPLAWIAFLFRKDHRGLHDLLAGTVVVEKE